MTSISEKHVPARKRWRERVLPRGGRLRERRYAHMETAEQPKPVVDPMSVRLERELRAVKLMIEELRPQMVALERQRDTLIRRLRLHQKKSTKK